MAVTDESPVCKNVLTPEGLSLPRVVVPGGDLFSFPDSFRGSYFDLEGLRVDYASEICNTHS